MRSLSCVGGCVLAGLRGLMSEHSSMIFAAMAVGAFLGAAFGGIMETLAGAGVGLVLVVLYGIIPRMTDCTGGCPIQ